MTLLAENPARASLSENSYLRVAGGDNEEPTIESSQRRATPDMRIQVTGAHASWLPAVIARFEHLLSLRRGWDGEEGEPVGLDAVRSALNLVAYAAALDTRQPSVVPDADGELQIEWHFGGLDVEIATQPHCTYLILFEDQHTSEDWEAEGSVRSSALLTALRRVAQRSRAID